MDAGWVQLLVAFVGGSLITAVITAFVRHCVFHPVISVRLDRERGVLRTDEDLGAVNLHADGQLSEAKRKSFARSEPYWFRTDAIIPAP
jgi:hypothetical protein